MAGARAALVCTLAIGGVVGVPDRAAAAERAVRDVVYIPPDRVVERDLYGAGRRVVVDGTVDGDLVAVAHGEVRVRGVVTGDVLALAPVVVVEGEVGGALRVLAGTIVVTAGGRVGDDTVVGAWALDHGGRTDNAVFGVAMLGRLGVDGQVRSVSLRGWSLLLEGKVERSVEFLGRRLVVDGVVGGNVVSTGRIEVTDDAVVSGSVRRPPIPSLPVKARSGVVVVVVGVTLGALALGPLVAWLSPDGLRRAIGRARRRGWWMPLHGAAALAVGSVTAGVLAWAASRVGWGGWLAVGATAVGLFTVATMAVLAVRGVVPVVVTLGHRIVGDRRSHLAAHVVGTLVLVAVLAVPRAGWWAAAVALLGAVGAGMPADVTERPANGWFSSVEGEGGEQGDGGGGGEHEDPGPDDLGGDA